MVDFEEKIQSLENSPSPSIFSSHVANEQNKSNIMQVNKYLDFI